MRFALAFAVSLVGLCGPAYADDMCGDLDFPCEIDSGSYYIALPSAPENAPWVVYLHGFGGQASSILANEAFVDGFVSRGYALILPQGLPVRPDAPPGWAIRDAWIYPRDWDYPRDDVAYIGDVIEDATSRFGLDPARGIVGGFSDGGSMTWDLACLAPDIASAFAPIAGGFWEPITETCEGPVHLLHTHGFSDPVVPLEGRAIRTENFAGLQSDIHAGLQLWRRTMGCRPNADDHSIEDGFWRKRWTECAEGSLELVLHPGGHRRPDGWTNLMLDWFEGLPD